MRYYVYALIDPTSDNKPFYIGKGLDNRLQNHFKSKLTDNQKRRGIDVVGCDPKSIMIHAQEDPGQTFNINHKNITINKLAKQGFNETSIARIIARRLNEPEATAVEACLIKSVYGVNELTNVQEGEHAERFRPYNTWDYIEGFDQAISENGHLSIESDHWLGKYYIYALFDPELKEIFYVGKGTGPRIRNHFELDDKSDIVAAESDRLKKIRWLQNRGFSPSDVGRILARVDSESLAFTLEALFVKFVFGFGSLTNLVPGHHSDKFRAKDDWKIRKGFDLPFITEPGVRQDRSEKLDLMVGEGLNLPLIEIQNAFPQLKFEEPKVLDSSELGIEAIVGNNERQVGATLKVFIRRKKIQIELRRRNIRQRKWIIGHFQQLGAYPLRRADDVFFPDAWRGAKNMTDNVEEAIRRVSLLLEIVSAKNREELSEHALILLQGLPKK